MFASEMYTHPLTPHGHTTSTWTHLGILVHIPAHYINPSGRTCTHPGTTPTHLGIFVHIRAQHIYPSGHTWTHPGTPHLAILVHIRAYKKMPAIVDLQLSLFCSYFMATAHTSFPTGDANPTKDLIVPFIIGSRFEWVNLPKRTFGRTWTQQSMHTHQGVHVDIRAYMYNVVQLHPSLRSL